MMWDYVSDQRSYYCPQDHVHEWRSFSINGRLAGQRANSGGGTTFDQMKESASNVFCFIEEADPRGYNMQSFYTGGNPLRTWQSADWIGAFHGKSVNMSYLDGHVLNYKLIDHLSYDAGYHPVVGKQIPNSNPDMQYLVNQQKIK
jgi:prepilin-type processing-associated H-X9-DG protein